MASRPAGLGMVLRAAALALAGAWLAAGAARAEDAASEWFRTDQGRVRLVAATPAIAKDERTVELGLEFRLAPHWKIYWRSPGDAGYPPRLDWTGSTNLAGAVMSWPAPQRFSVQGLETVGYSDAVVFPIAARLERPGESAHFHLALSYLTCSTICIPYDTVLALDLPAGTPSPGAMGHGPLIARFAARVPGEGSAGGLELGSATLTPDPDPMLELRVESDAPLVAPDAFVEGPAGIAFGRPHLTPGEQPGEALLQLPAYGERGALDRLVGQPLTVTLVDGGRAIEAAVTPAAGRPAGGIGWSLLGILPLALLGGFILNFMPCVLPVLSIKLLGAIEQGGRSRRAVRLGFLATAAGIILSFLVLAALMAGLEGAGAAVGWGVQFQAPLFLVGMAALLTLFACNLWGFFEVPLPRWLGRVAEAGEGRSLLGNVGTGALATLLATPCSAPFLGTAVGFALAAGPAEIFIVFLVLGLGLSAPYLAAAALPGFARWLPRPGHWMVTFRRLLGIALAGTALWLLSILVEQAGLEAALVAGGLITAAALALALLRSALARRILPAALTIAAFLVPAILAAPPAGVAGDAFWRPFDRAEIARLVGEGHVVFVDVTADWCLTCKLNEELVIDAPAVRSRLSSPDLVAMRADWTRPNAAIAAYLRSFGRYGIPFNAVYGPARPGGIALSEILTTDRVLAALSEAGGPGRVAGAPEPER